MKCNADDNDNDNDNARLGLGLGLRLRESMFASIVLDIVLAGGGTLFPGFGPRLTLELCKLDRRESARAMHAFLMLGHPRLGNGASHAARAVARDRQVCARVVWSYVTSHIEVVAPVRYSAWSGGAQLARSMPMPEPGEGGGGRQVQVGPPWGSMRQRRPGGPGPRLWVGRASPARAHAQCSKRA